MSGSVDAVSFDVLGTLVELDDPPSRLRSNLAELAGVSIDEDAARRAFAREVRYYLDHHLQGRDRESLAELRSRCAAIVVAELGLDVRLQGAVGQALVRALCFRRFQDAADTLALLRHRSLRCVCASNWDCSLPEVLERVGLLESFDAVVWSAQVGAAKPDPAPLIEALELAGCPPHRAVHVGDSDLDVQAARACGARPILIARDSAGTCEGKTSADVEVIPTLFELGTLILE